jgi:hypothetical protein
MREAFREIRYTAKSLEKLGQAQRIINEYRDQNYRMSNRQIYYQFVARDLIANQQNEYKNLCKLLKNGRYTGDLDWDDIEDRVRGAVEGGEWGRTGNPNAIKLVAGIVDHVAPSYSVDLWAKTQNFSPEIWLKRTRLLVWFNGSPGNGTSPTSLELGTAAHLHLSVTPTAY